MILRGVTVVDTRDGSLTPNVDVILDGERIAAITLQQEESGGPSDSIVEAAGKFVVPGFLDMHTHTLEGKDPAERWR